MRFVFTALVAGACAAMVTARSTGAGEAMARVSIHVAPAIRYQTVTGFGQGSMDQANPKWRRAYPRAELDKVLDRLYTLKDAGLGLTICRTYIVGGDAPGHDHMRRRAGGSRNPLAYEPADGTFRWDGHEDCLWHARGAARRGATMLAFWNSPPHWMTESGCASGSKTGKTDNLRREMEARFARHMCDVLVHFRDAWEIDFDYVCPINEPEAGWWKAGGGQEGCHVGAGQAVRIICHLQKELARRRLRAKVHGPEAAFGNTSGYVRTILEQDEAAKALAVLTCHQYIAKPGPLRDWARIARASHKGLWMSEWGDWKNRKRTVESNVVQAMGYAGKIHEALDVMQAEAWCMWEPQNLFDENDGDDENEATLAPRKSFRAVAHYSRFARPGMRRVHASSRGVKAAAFLDEKTRSVAVVLLNDTDEPVAGRIGLAGVSGLRLDEARRTSPGEDFATVTPGRDGDAIVLDLPATSIASLRFTYDRATAFVTNGGFETGEATGWRCEGAAGVESSYPAGGLFDGYLHPTAGGGCRMWQRLEGLDAGAEYVLHADCAASATTSHFAVESGGNRKSAAVSGTGYKHVELPFTSGRDGGATIAYEAPPTTRKPGAKVHPWATVDNVFVMPR